MALDFRVVHTHTHRAVHKCLNLCAQKHHQSHDSASAKPRPWAGVHVWLRWISTDMVLFSPPQDLMLNASLWSFKTSWRDKLHLPGKPHTCLKTEKAPPHSNSKTRCCTHISTLEFTLVWVIYEMVEADRFLKIIARGLYSEGALKYFLIIFASTPPNTVNQELFPNTLYCSSATLHRRGTNWVGHLPAPTVRWPRCSHS